MAPATSKTSRNAVGTMFVAGVCGCLLPSAMSFVAPSSAEDAVSKDGSTVAASRAGVSLRGVSAATMASDSEVASTPSSLLLPLVALAFAGATRAVQKRETKVDCGARARKRWGWRFGGEGAPKTPHFLTLDNQAGVKSVSGVPQPAWLTLQKWQSFSAKNKARSMRWWVQAHDENGIAAYDEKKSYTIEQAVEIILAMNARAPPKFDASLEAHMQMNLDQRYPDQQIRTAITLPHGTGKKIRVAVFCTDEEAEEVKEAGAFKWGNELAQEIAEDKLDFDVLLAKPQMMPRLAKLGKILGPKRLMPSPKSGTVVQDYAAAIKEFSAGKMELRMDRNALVQSAVGRLSFGREQLIENFRGLLKGMADNAPPGANAKKFWKADGVFMGSTLSPSIRIDASEFPKVTKLKV
eukprot:TRINITY_DN11515_c0_g1_i1.p1 TRINITY_DN11515_c0_g1~~TRINITY_DN11515_c0_g1_i1.p1  ORF type:complete len:436 (-),score=115.09 TRINITY_DN11515_c0_g1_i1:124-1347(-)